MAANWRLQADGAKASSRHGQISHSGWLSFKVLKVLIAAALEHLDEQIVFEVNLFGISTTFQGAQNAQGAQHEARSLVLGSNPGVRGSEAKHPGFASPVKQPSTNYQLLTAWYFSPRLSKSLDPNSRLSATRSLSRPITHGVCSLSQSGN